MRDLGVSIIVKDLSHSFSADRRRTIVVVTDEMGFVREVADSLIFMGEGEIVEVGTSEYFFNNSEHE